MLRNRTKGWFRVTGLGLLLFALATCAGCSKSKEVSLPGLDAPEQMTLYSINFKFNRWEESKHGEEQLHGFPVLGKIEITDAASRKEIAKAVKEGAIVEDDGAPMADCFWPRHALRIVENGKTFDFVICFQCTQFEYYPDGATESVSKPITSKPRVVLNKYLQKAGIPLVPGGDEE